MRMKLKKLRKIIFAGDGVNVFAGRARLDRTPSIARSGSCARMESESGLVKLCHGGEVEE